MSFCSVILLLLSLLVLCCLTLLLSFGRRHFDDNDSPEDGVVINDTSNPGVFVLTTSVGVFKDPLLPLSRRRRIFICIDLLTASFSKNPLVNIACLMLSIGHRANNLTAFLIRSASNPQIDSINCPPICQTTMLWRRNVS